MCVQELQCHNLCVCIFQMYFNKGKYIILTHLGLKKNQDWDLSLLRPQCSMCYADSPPYIIHENACYFSFRYPLSVFISHCNPVDSGVLSQPCSCNINLNTLFSARSLEVQQTDKLLAMTCAAHMAPTAFIG